MTLADLMHQLHVAADAVFFVGEQIEVQRKLLADGGSNGHDIVASAENLAVLEESHRSLLARLRGIQAMLAPI
ncbi:MAG TPA: hypothetical protein VN667_01020 [Burkholderiales bacterium]|nr:hypothetical protein [Burkholderiales bacterium]